MPRKSRPVPTYSLHKSSGQARVRVRQPDGRYRDVLLGKFGSPESKAEYARLLASLTASPAATAMKAGRRKGAGPGPTVNELILAFLRHADGYYPAAALKGDGEPASFRLSLRPVRELVGHTPAAEFGPLALKAVRQHMVESGLSRGVVNRRVNRVRRAFKWAASEEIVPHDTYARLTTVAGLGKGRTTAREAPPVGPVPIPDALATLPHLNRVVAGMVRSQLLTGMRPGEVRRLRPAEVDRSGPVWTYSPGQHKGAWRGKVRRVKIGPQAQAVLAPFLGGDPDRPAFSPKQATAERHDALRAARKSKVQPSQASRKKAATKHPPGDTYTRRTYAQAVERAAAKAGVGHWHPNQLRHTFATEVRKRHGLEAAQVLLGHVMADVTQVYAERDDGLADRVAGEIG